MFSVYKWCIECAIANFDFWQLKKKDKFEKIERKIELKKIWENFYIFTF